MKLLVFNFLAIIAIGVATVYSATYKSLIGAGMPSYSHTLELGIMIAFLAIIYIIVLSNRKVFYKLINYNINTIYYILFVCLIIVLTPLGSAAGGARSSISILSFKFQPIELFKIISILYMAKMLSEDTGKLSDKDFLYYKLSIPALSILLIVLEPDIGGVMILSTTLLTMLFVNNKRNMLTFKILFGFLVLVVIAFIALYFLGWDRIVSWLDPFNHLDKAGGNLVESYVAISNGGLFGLGYLNSIQNSGFLFASSTDFIFSIIAEEFGIIGVVTVLTLMFTLAYQIYYTGYETSRKYEYLVCSGIAFLILIQTAINVGGVTGVIPMTGVPLPFISRGINSYVALSLAVLYVMLIKLRTQEEKKNAKKKKRIAQGRRS